MYSDYSNENRGAYYYAITMMFIALSCLMLLGLTRSVNDVNDSHIPDNFMIYYILISTVNAIICLITGFLRIKVINSLRIKVIVTVLMTVILPLVHLMDEKTTLIAGDVRCVFLVVINLFFVCWFIDDWREKQTVGTRNCRRSNEGT